MIKYIVGAVIGIAIATTFPEQTADLSEFLREQINAGAKVVVEQTDQNLVDKVSNR